MPSEGEMMNAVLTSRDFDIAGNVFRAYYDPDEKLVFVLDSTVDDRKPNVLLVINPVGDRKWDDILANDYHVDLETVRPKKDNKYQKLDIEYSGLAQYDNLIHAYENGDDLTDALVALGVFRDVSVHRAATERLAVADAAAARARETILRTNDSITELQGRLKQLRSKLAQQKKQIGREPTKQSASKILRTDAQIDAVNEKLHRAKKRLNNAQRRLVAADADDFALEPGIPDMRERHLVLHHLIGEFDGDHIAVDADHLFESFVLFRHFNNQSEKLLICHISADPLGGGDKIPPAVLPVASPIFVDYRQTETVYAQRIKIEIMHQRQIVKEFPAHPVEHLLTGRGIRRRQRRSHAVVDRAEIFRRIRQFHRAAPPGNLGAQVLFEPRHPSVNSGRELLRIAGPGDSVESGQSGILLLRQLSGRQFIKADNRKRSRSIQLQNRQRCAEKIVHEKPLSVIVGPGLNRRSWIRRKRPPVR